MIAFRRAVIRPGRTAGRRHTVRRCLDFFLSPGVEDAVNVCFPLLSLWRGTASSDAGEAVLVVPQQGRNRRKRFLIQQPLPASLLGESEQFRCPLPASPGSWAYCAPAGGPARAAAPPGVHLVPVDPGKEGIQTLSVGGLIPGAVTPSARPPGKFVLEKGVRFTLFLLRNSSRLGRTPVLAAPRSPVRCRWPGPPDPGGTACAPPGRHGRCRR